MIKSKKLDLVSEFKENNEFDEKIIKILGRDRCRSSSVLLNPENFSFSQQRKLEKVILAIRPHWVTNHSWLVIAFVLLILPILFLSLGFSFFMPLQYKIAFYMFWYLTVLIYAFERFLSWYFDVHIITNQRVISLSFNNLLIKHFAEANLDKIQDVSSSVKGILGTFFNYGDVLIQTASESNKIIFENICHPDKIIKLLKEFCNLEEGSNDSK